MVTSGCDTRSAWCCNSCSESAARDSALCDCMCTSDEQRRICWMGLVTCQGEKVSQRDVQVLLQTRQQKGHTMTVDVIMEKQNLEITMCSTDLTRTQLGLSWHRYRIHQEAPPPLSGRCSWVSWESWGFNISSVPFSSWRQQLYPAAAAVKPKGLTQWIYQERWTTTTEQEGPDWQHQIDNPRVDSTSSRGFEVK